MPDPYPPSEFGGKTGPNGFQPVPPHVMTASEKLRALYTTGDESGQSSLDDGDAFTGMLPEDEQRAIRAAQGAFEKGEYDPFKAV